MFSNINSLDVYYLFYQIITYLLSSVSVLRSGTVRTVSDCANALKSLVVPATYSSL